MTSEDVSTSQPNTCAQCNRVLAEGEPRETTSGGVFCQPCFAALRQQVEAAVAQQGEGINYVNAVAGGLGGGVVGALVWWGFTVLTHVSFGLVAVVIGVLVGKGVVMATGGKRTPALQAISVAIAAVAFFYATFLVNRSFILKSVAEQTGLHDAGIAIPFVPSPSLMLTVVKAGFQFFDLVFLAIALYEAWKIPSPFRLGRR